MNNLLILLRTLGRETKGKETGKMAVKYPQMTQKCTALGTLPKTVWQYSTFLGPGPRNSSCVSKKLKNCAKVRPDVRWLCGTTGKWIPWSWHDSDKCYGVRYGGAVCAQCTLRAGGVCVALWHRLESWGDPDMILADAMVCARERDNLVVLRYHRMRFLRP